MAEENFVDARSAPAGYRASGYELVWHLENLEPTTADDLNLRVIIPDYWETVLAVRQEVAKEPTGRNYFRLAAAYGTYVNSYNPADSAEDKAYAFYSPLLAQVTAEQYRKAIVLLPHDNSMRQDYLNFLRRFAGTLLPGTVNDYLNQLPPADTATPRATTLPSTPTKTLVPRTAIATGELPTQPPVPTLEPPTPTDRPSTQVAALPTAPLFTPVPVPVADDNGGTLNTALIVAFVALIAVGVVIALRRR